MAHGKENVGRKAMKADNHYHCDICTKSFTRIDVLQSHLLRHLGKKPFQCNYCKKSFNQRNHLKLHRRIHTGERPYSCKHCDFTSKYLHAIKSHMTKHTKVFQCPVCKKSLRNRQSLDSHMKNHNGERPYSCKECNASFSSPKSLRQHKLKHTTGRINCHVCQKSISFLGFRQHMKIHTNDRAIRPFTCSKCNETFREKRSLQRHVLKHNYECRVCKTLFTSAEALSNHMKRKHEVECKICKKVLSSNKGLIQHMTTHAGEGQTKCIVCRKRFEREELLVMHMLYSCTNRPFRCTVCSRYFTKKDNLKRHMKLVHEKSGVQHEAIINVTVDKLYDKKTDQEDKTSNGENCNANGHKTCKNGTLSQQTYQESTEKENNFGNIENTFKAENILDQNCTVKKRVTSKETVSAMKIKPIKGQLIDNKASKQNKSTKKHKPLQGIVIDNHRAIYTDHSVKAILESR